MPGTVVTWAVAIRVKSESRNKVNFLILIILKVNIYKITL
jgi:hypothetical protein